jgi:hypothetical protein
VGDQRPLETGWLADTPVDDSILRQFGVSQGALNARWAEAGGGRSQRTPDVALADSGTTIPYFNQAFLQRPVSSIDDPVLDVVDDFFAGMDRPASLLSMWPTPDLSARGWRLEGHPMLVVRGPWGGDPRRPGDAALVRDVGPDDVATFERVFVEGYPMPGGTIPVGLLERGVTLRLGVVDGEPVAAAAGFVHSGIVNLCGAATLPAARRSGAWGALVRARMADAPDLPAAAYTSDFSRPGFVHLGFLPVTRFTIWER